METNGTVTEIQGIEGTITIKQRITRDQKNIQNIEFVDEMDEGGKHHEPDIVVVEAKRKRVDHVVIERNQGKDNINILSTTIGPKNGPEAGTGLQARIS